MEIRKGDGLTVQCIYGLMRIWCRLWAMRPKCSFGRMCGWTGSLCDRFKRKYDLADNRLLTVDRMYSFD